HVMTVHDVTHRELAQLAAPRPRDVGDRDDLRRHVSRRRARPHLVAYPPAEVVVDGHTGRGHHEQDDPRVTVPFLTDGEALHHFAELLDLPVDLRGTDADAARVERGVGPAVEDDAAVLGPRTEVALVPDTGEPFEVRGPEAGVAVVGPEAQRHRRER